MRELDRLRSLPDDPTRIEDLALRRAARLVRGVPPLERSPERIERIRRAVMAGAPQASRGAVRARQRIRWIPRTGIALGILSVASAAFALTVVVRHGIFRPAKPAILARPAAATAPAPPPRAMAQPMAPPRSVDRPAVAVVKPASRRPSEGEEEAAEASVVLYAMSVLRKEHDAARAAKLLDGYLAANPDGLVVEEALALDIEAATDLNDPRAAKLAEQYLDRFPNGRFALVARAAQQRFANE